MEINNDLIWTSFVIFFLGFMTLRNFYTQRTSLLLASFKVVVFFSYYYLLYSPAETYQDSVVYRWESEVFAYISNNPFTIFFQEGIYQGMKKTAEGIHIFYGWWNYVGDYYFGRNDFGVSALNVLLSIGVSCIFILFSQEVGFSKEYAKCLGVFSLFQWDLLAWSTVVNLKSTSLVFFIFLFFYSSFIFLKKNNWLGAVGIVIGLFFLIWIRIYIAIMLSGIFAIMVLLETRNKKIVISSFLIIGLLGGIILNKFGVSKISRFFVFDPNTFFYNIIRFWLTPKPWGIVPHAKFQYFTSVFHLIFFIPFLIGAIKLIKEKKIFWYVLSLLVGLSMFYGMRELNGVGARHRVQFAFFICWAQFHFLWPYIKKNRDVSKNEPN